MQNQRQVHVSPKHYQDAFISSWLHHCQQNKNIQIFSQTKQTYNSHQTHKPKKQNLIFQKQNHKKKPTVTNKIQREPLRCWEISNINQLKKQAKILDQNTVGSLRRIADNFDKQEILTPIQYQCHSLANTISHFGDKSKLKLNNPRKIAKGRPNLHTESQVYHHSKQCGFKKTKSRELTLKSRNMKLSKGRVGSSIVVKLLNQYNKQLKFKDSEYGKNTQVFKINNFLTIY